MPRLWSFFSLTFVVSWSAWIGRSAVLGTGDSRPLPQAIGGFLYILGVFAPALVALFLPTRAEGRAGALGLLRRTIKAPAGARWYVLAVTYMAAVKLGAAVLHRLAVGHWPPFGQESLFIMAIAMLFSTPVQAGEELGWRGYALSPLSVRFGLPGASIVLGVVWACWHLPFFFLPGNDKTGQSFPVYLMMVTALSVAMAWLYWRTDGSLLLTMLMHAAINNTKDIVPSGVPAGSPAFFLGASLVAWLSAAILWACAVYFLVRMRGVKLPVGPHEASPASPGDVYTRLGAG